MKGSIVSMGGTKVFAAIGVSCAAGSMLSCAKGALKLSGKAVMGHWIFAVPETGVWTVTATDGTNSKSTTVEITAQGQLEEISLSFEQVLFDSSVTSGWAAAGYSEHEAGISGGMITLVGDPTLTSGALQNVGLYYYGEKLKCTSGMTLKVSVTAAGCSYGGFNSEGKAKLVAVSDPAAVDTDIMETVDSCTSFVASASIAKTGVTSLSLPEGEYYLGIAFSNYVQLSADKVWLE